MQAYKEANDEDAIVGGEIELHILDKSGIVKEEEVVDEDSEDEVKKRKKI